MPNRTVSLNHRILPSKPLEEHTTFHRPYEEPVSRVQFTHPAREVMTDLKNKVIVTIPPDALLDEAHHKMKQRGIRMLIVVDAQDEIMGLITANDVSGEKPMQYIQQNGGLHKDITVRDIMTPKERIEVLEIDDVCQANVGDIIETLKNVNRQHALIVDHQENDHQKLRGLVSLNQIARQLGIDSQHFKAAQTLADIAALRTKGKQA